MINVHRFYKIIGLISVLSFCVAAMAVAEETINWRSYDEGMALGKSEQKKVYINFYADWCGYCRKMEKETFTDENVITFLNEKYISIRVNADKERKVALEYKAFALPDNAFFTEKGEIIGKQPGYLSPSDFMKLITFIYEEKYKSAAK